MDFPGYAVLKSLSSMSRFSKVLIPLSLKEKAQILDRAFPLFSSFSFYYSCWSRAFFHVDVIDSTILRWFLGLTCDFWAENDKRKFGEEIKVM